MDFSFIWDAHCHGHDSFAGEKQLDFHFLRKVKTGHVTLMGVRPDDWGMVEQVAQIDINRIVPAFGVHPWFAHKYVHQEGDEWLKELEAKLVKNPRSIMGEIGLDRIATTPDTQVCEYDLQLVVFQRQLDLAATLKKPVSVHCVRAFGAMADIFRARAPENLPPKIMMHSYGGSEAMVTSLVKLPKKVGRRIYFSFSFVINCCRSNDNGTGKLEAAIAAVPDDRICLESDMNSFRGLDGLMKDVCEAVAKAKGWTVEETVMRTFENARRFFEEE